MMDYYYYYYYYYYYWRIDSDISRVLYTHTHRVQTLYLRHVWVDVILLLRLDG